MVFSDFRVVATVTVSMLALIGNVYGPGGVRSSGLIFRLDVTNP